MDKPKSKDQIVDELPELRQQIAELERLELERDRALEMLHESEARYRALFDRSIHCVYIYDLEGRFLDANEAALNLLGYEREEITSLSFESLLDEGQVTNAYMNLKELIRTGSARDMAEYKLKRKDGAYVWVETDASLIDRQGKPFAVQGVAKDITERKRPCGIVRRIIGCFSLLNPTPS
jgi:PAS domain S-box-containing protein